MMTQSSVNISYEILPLVNLAAPRVQSRRSRPENAATPEVALQDAADAKTILGHAGLEGNPTLKNLMEASEKYMVETQSVHSPSQSSETQSVEQRQKGSRKPHYTRLLIGDGRLIFQAACCLPLKVIAASSDGNVVSGRALFSSHSEEAGGKLVYEFQGKGAEMIVDVKRGESTRAQRLIFRGIP